MEEAIQYYAPEWRDEVAAAFQLCIREGTPYDEEMEIITAGDNRLWVRTTGEAVRDSMGKIVGVQGSFQDITARKEAENKLKESEERFRMFFEQAGDAVFVHNLEEQYVEVNERACSSLGYSRDELMAISVSDTEVGWEPKNLHELWEDLEANKVITTTGEQRRKDGSTFPVEIRLRSIQRNGQKLMMVMARDISFRKQEEEQMAASLKEKKVLLREIHHRTKNNMQVMISLLRIQSENTENKQFAGMLKESWNRIKSMALVHEKLYQSKGLADVDFKGYVKSLVGSIFSSYGASAAGITSIAETDDVSIGLETAIPCGLIINELVSNSLKYAFPGNRKGEIRVALRSFDEDALVLEVGDNGIGMPEDLDFRDTASMGLHLVNILSEDQLHGKVELDRAGGTTFRIRFKNHKYEARV